MSDLLGGVAALGLVELPDLEEELQAVVEVLHLLVDVGHSDEDAAVAGVVFSLYLLVHFKRLLQKTECVLEVARFHVASMVIETKDGVLSQEGEDLGVELLGLLQLREQTPIQLQGRSQVV